MVAQHLQGGVVAGALGEVHQTHVVANDEGQAQRHAAEDGERRGGGLHHGHGLLVLVGGTLDGADLVHLVQLMAA